MLSKALRVLRFRETVYDQNDRPFELHTAANRGDGYQWTSVLGSTSDAPTSIASQGPASVETRRNLVGAHLDIQEVERQ